MSQYILLNVFYSVCSKDKFEEAKFWDLKNCQWSQQNIFDLFKNFKKIQNFKFFTKNLKKHKFSYISATVWDRGKLTKFGDHTYG